MNTSGVFQRKKGVWKQVNRVRQALREMALDLKALYSVGGATDIAWEQLVWVR